MGIKRYTPQNMCGTNLHSCYMDCEKPDGNYVTYEDHIAKVKKYRDALLQYREAMEFTRQYVGYEMLPEIKGWSWYDADCIAKEALEET